MKYLHGLTAVVASVACAAILTACGTSTVKSSDVTITVAPSTGTSAATDGAAPPAPNRDQLDKQLHSLLGPGTSDDAKLALIDGGEAFRTNLPDLSKALRDNPNAQFGVADPIIHNTDGTLGVTFWYTQTGNMDARQTVAITFRPVDGAWKVSKEDVCGILGTQIKDYHSPACS